MSKAYSKLYEEVGRALTLWSFIEEALCVLFARAIYPNRKTPIATAVQAYWAVLSFDAKLNMVDTAVRSRLLDDSKLMKSWNTLKNRLGEKSKKRNELAHGTVIGFKKATERVYFCPSFHKDLYSKVRYLGEHLSPTFNPIPQKKLTLKDVTQRRKAFGSLNGRLEKFLSEFSDELELLAAAEKIDTSSS